MVLTTFTRKAAAEMHQRLYVYLDTVALAVKFDDLKSSSIAKKDPIFIEIIRPGSRSESQNTILRCETVDVSVSGLRIYVPQHIAQGSKLNLAVPMEDWKENLELVGEAVWVKPVADGEGFWVGLELRDSKRENMEKWFKVVHKFSSTPQR